jgi:23S rRNA pseudouridine1911/1915/1917 synthase
MQVIYEDNHIIIVNKESGEIVQGDKTGDQPLSETVKQYIKTTHNKPGNVFLGVVHRLDRPVSGVVVFAKTSKALARLNDMFREGQVHKTYWAIVQGKPGSEADTLTGWITRNEKQNKSYIHPREVRGSKQAVLKYRLLACTDRYSLLEVQLLTGRHHQIRCQLSAMGCPIKGDLKYGAKRSNPDGSISLHARRVEFIHPVSKLPIVAEATIPNDNLWREITTSVQMP